MPSNERLLSRARAWMPAAFLLGVSALACRDATAPTLPAGELAYRSLAEGGLFLMRADGSGRRRVWFSTEDAVMCPSWSPDGSKIAFHKLYANQIFVVAIGTGEERQLTTGPDQNQCPIWSPDGRRIAFIRIPVGATGYALFVMNADGTNATRLGSGTFVADRGSWSPDGKLIAASSWDNQVVLVNAETGAVSIDSTPGIGARAPAWSPDGQQITFAGQENGNLAIYVMEADGKNVRRLTSTFYNDQYPVWTLDGRLITFHRYQYRSITPGAPILFASLHLLRLDGTEVPWIVGDSAQGDLPIWRPHS